MTTKFLTEEELEKIVTEKLLEFAQHDRDSGIYYAAWHAGHALDGDCDMPGSIVTRAVAAILTEYGDRIAVPKDARDDDGYKRKPDGYLYDLVYENDLISADGAVIVDIAGRQLVIAKRYGGEVGDGRTKIQELIPPIEFNKDDGAPIYTSRVDLKAVLANLVAALDVFTPAICDEGIQAIEASGLHDDSLDDFQKAGYAEADYRRSNASHALDTVRGAFDNKVAAALEAARAVLK